MVGSRCFVRRTRAGTSAKTANARAHASFEKCSDVFTTKEEVQKTNLLGSPKFYEVNETMRKVLWSTPLTVAR